MSYQEYTNIDDLHKIQKLSTCILAEFDRVCGLLHIPYVVYGGTAIGAVRHKGFIPWDDDVDVAMLRHDYERFLKEAPEVMQSTFALHNALNTDDFTSTYSYMVLKGTVHIPDFYDCCPYQKPISIDVFPLDKVATEDSARTKQMRKTWFWGRLMFLRATPTPYVPFDGLKKAVVHAMCRVVHYTLKLFRITPDAIYSHWAKAAMRYADDQTDFYADFSDREPMRWGAQE